MNKGRKAWLVTRPNGLQFLTLEYEHAEREGVFLTTDELAELVGEAEARGAGKFMPLELDDARLADACMSYRHDFGLLDNTNRENTIHDCRAWYKAIRRAFWEPTPMIEQADKAYTDTIRQETLESAANFLEATMRENSGVMVTQEILDACDAIRALKG